jgi:hypothetical protein
MDRVNPAVPIEPSWLALRFGVRKHPNSTEGLPMNNADLIEKVATANGFGKAETKALLDSVFAASTISTTI